MKNASKAIVVITEIGKTLLIKAETIGRSKIILELKRE